MNLTFFKHKASQNFLFIPFSSSFLKQLKFDNNLILSVRFFCALIIYPWKNRSWITLVFNKAHKSENQQQEYQYNKQQRGKTSLLYQILRVPIYFSLSSPLCWGAYMVFCIHKWETYRAEHNVNECLDFTFKLTLLHAHNNRSRKCGFFPSISYILALTRQIKLFLVVF